MRGKIAGTQPLPEYSLHIGRDDRHELVTLFRDPSKPGRSPRGFRPVAVEIPSESSSDRQR
jgi:hypothetical protein